MLGPQDSILQILLEPEGGPEADLSVKFFHEAIMLNKIPKIHVKCFQTLDATASGLDFTTPS